MSSVETSVFGFEPNESDIKRARELGRMVANATFETQVIDPVESALLNAMAPELSAKGHLTPFVEGFFEMRRTRGNFLPTGYALRIIEFAVDKQMRSMFSSAAYPQKFTSPAQWEEYDIFSHDPNTAKQRDRSKDLISQKHRLDYFDLYEDTAGELRSNIPNGYEIFKLLSYAHRDRWSKPPVVVDIGGSMGLGLKKWLLDDKYPFEPMRIVNPPKTGEPISEYLSEDKESQQIIDRLVSKPTVIGQAFNTDLLPVHPTSPSSINLIFSHTFPFSETIRNYPAAEEFNKLAWEFPRNYEHVMQNVDITDRQSFRNLSKQLPGGRADIFTISATLFEIDPDKSTDVFENIRLISRPGALCYISDFARPKAGEPLGLEFTRRNWWHRAGAFATFVYDPFQPDKPPEEVFRFLSRRCEAGWLTRAGKKLFADAA